ncbi:hypothetical protein [Aliiglaciecola sp. NS0011-25]|uniref:hypothetical protein n=1 Tax=Aliiglaciecola sp. NS0011-25 TaxID=3127654 RepID=UPI003108BB93
MDMKIVKTLKSELDKVTQIIESSSISDLTSETKKNTNLSAEVNETLSLLERCAQIVDTHENQTKPLLRVLHHFACSGGTVIAKILSSLPNVYLLSEVHPTTMLHLGNGEPRYLPSDLIAQSRYAQIPDIDSLALKIFSKSVKQINDHVVTVGGHLIIRDHSHSDFCIGSTFRTSSQVADCLVEDFELLRVVTVRDPIDSYLSLLSSKWDHFDPKGFDEYCRRYLVFISEYRQEHIFKYESFLNDPSLVISKIASHLNLPFSERVFDFFDIYKMSGDSGRVSSKIEARPRRDLSDELKKEISQSEFYAHLREKLEY